MHIQNVTLYTDHFRDQVQFYTQRLGLSLVERTDDQFTVVAGASTLTLRRADTSHINHIAFNIPEHQFEDALTWAQARFDVLPHAGKPYVDFSDTSWRAHSLYFEDAAGNVLEFIARHRLAAPDAPETFGPGSVQRISEIGLAANDVSRLAGPLQSALGAPVFSGDPAEGFCALGDDDGLLICVETGRAWMPTDNRLSVVAPLNVTITGEPAATHTVDGYPYQVSVASGAA